MASVAAPVAVVTSADGALPVGTTVSAFTSLSMTPPMVMVALDRGSETLRHIVESTMFGLNVLGVEQQDIALAFARKGGTGKFDGIGWSRDHDLPRLHGCAGWIACRSERVVDGGDHVIVLGEVVAAEHRDCDPLTYHRRTFGTHSAFTTV
ncbi:flavin reductase family protein [Nocardia asteroides]|uniref:flavin reductase family protein n=1 Tax=Nocardia asteroides TaxID=1824 RepID=UPI001E45891E|nr:flavin reductase family protein [Nocardia asteroides]UGT65226.1 flavin reductase family protein [Nocardia asteroides]